MMKKRNFKKFLVGLALITAGSLSACGKKEPNTHVITIEYTVKSGDTLSSIAERYDVTVDAIIKENGINRPNSLDINDVITIPLNVSNDIDEEEYVTKERIYTVSMGDTLTGISNRYFVSIDEIMRTNGLTDTTIYPGQKLKVKVKIPKKYVEEEKKEMPSEPYDIETIIYTIEEGDTLLSIAEKYNVTVDEIIEWNKIKNPDLVVAGTEIVINKIVLLEETKNNDISASGNLYTHTIQYGETLSSIADTYGTTTEELIKLNNIENPDLIEVNDVIIVGNSEIKEENMAEPIETTEEEEIIAEPIETQEEIIVETSESKEESSFSRISKMFEQIKGEEDSNSDVKRYVGIDVSEYQGNIDWKTVKEQNVDFAIIRFTDFGMDTHDNDRLEGRELDERFYEYVIGCKENNIPIGIYYYTRATTTEEAMREAQIVASHLDILKENGYSLDCPVYIDAETEELNYMMYYRPDEFKTVFTPAIALLRSRGYAPGLYVNKTNAGYITDMSSICSLWFTSNETYDNAVEVSELQDPDYRVVYNPDEKIAMYQYCQKGYIKGINGDVDVDYANQLIFTQN